MILTALLVSAVVLPAAQAKSERPRNAISSTIVLKVTDRNQAADALIAEAERLGGYFSTRDDNQVILVVPAANARALIAKVEPMGVVVQRSFAANDVTARLRELRTRLKSREEVFRRYFSVLQSAGQGTVVQVEAQMTSLVTEIESIKGSIRLIAHQLEYGTITVQFQFRERRPPSRDGNSSFAWLNTVNLADLFAEFSHVH